MNLKAVMGKNITELPSPLKPARILDSDEENEACEDLEPMPLRESVKVSDPRGELLKELNEYRKTNSLSKRKIDDVE